MELWQMLGLRSGVTAVIGSGGKTTLLRRLGEELARRGRRVLLTTTTHIRPFPGLPCVTGAERALYRAALNHSPLVCAGTVAADGKLTAPSLSAAELADLFDYVLVEADGAAGRPMKAHMPWEPVIPPASGRVICVVGASGLGLPIREAAHRPGRFAELAGVPEDAAVTPELAGRVLTAEGLADFYLITQAEDALLRGALDLGNTLPFPAAAGAFERGAWTVC